MTKVIMNGCNGHMGHVISDLCEKDSEIEIVAGIDINTEQHYGYPVFANIGDCDVAADAIIDFSHVSCIDAVSYTHLDVYKRQLLHRIRRIFKEIV